MPHIRRLPSGLWRAEVRMPGGRRVGKSDPLKSVVRTWAEDLEAEYRRGSMRDPKAGLITIGQWYERWRPSRRWSKRHAERMDGVWRVHVKPHWQSWPLQQITQMDVRQWLTGLGSGPATVRKCRDLLSAMLGDAVLDGRITVNPARLPKGTLPRMPERPPDFYTHGEVAALVEAAGGHGLMLDLDAHIGLRWAELAALAPEHVDERTGQIYVVRVAERDGEIRDYPKSRQRAVPIPDHLIGDLLELHGAFVFPAPRGGVWRYNNFRHRVWLPAIRAAGLRDLGIHGLRHTSASWMVMAGVPLFTVREILGHSSTSVTERYAHLAPGTHDAVRLAWSRNAAAPAPYETATDADTIKGRAGQPS